MKVKTPEDRVRFLVDVNRTDLLESVSDENADVDSIITSELIEVFLKKRKPLVNKMKDFKKSATAKQAWRENRFKYLSGIHRFHGSVQGKRFHKSMGRFLATRIFQSIDRPILLDDVNEHLKAISSVKTHLYIEADYYMPLQEEVDFRLFVDYAIPILNGVEAKLFADSEYCPTDEEMELMLRLVQRDTLQKSIEESTQQTLDLGLIVKKVSKNLPRESSSFMLAVMERVKETIKTLESKNRTKG